LAKGKPKLTVKEMKRDPLVELFEQARGWFFENSDKYKKPAIIVAAVILVAVGIYYLLSFRTTRAESRLASALEIYNAPVADPLPKNEPIAFKTDKEKYEKALQAFNAASGAHSTYGEIAQYYAAISQLKLDAAKGRAQLEALTTRNSLVGRLALFALADSYKQAGEYDKAAELFKKLSDSPGDMPKPMILLNLAGVYEAQGKKKEAEELYLSVAREDRSSEAGREAVNKLGALNPEAVESLPPEEPENDPLSRLLKSSPKSSSNK